MILSTGEDTTAVPNKYSQILNVDNVLEACVAIRQGDTATGSGRRNRKITDTLKRQVSDLYNAETTGGVAVIQGVLGVSKSTAIRYINAARAAGYIEPRLR